jgi:hypothetical protein
MNIYNEEEDENHVTKPTPANKATTPRRLPIWMTTGESPVVVPSPKTPSKPKAEANVVTPKSTKSKQSRKKKKEEEVEPPTEMVQPVKALKTKV